MFILGFPSIALRNQMTLNHSLENSPLICLSKRDKETLPVLTRKLSMHRYFSCEPQFEFFSRIAACHSLCVSHTLWEALSGGVLSSVFFIKFSETAQHLQTLKMYCMTAGKGMRRDRKTKQKKKRKKSPTTVNLCQVCFLHCQI